MLNPKKFFKNNLPENKANLVRWKKREYQILDQRKIFSFTKVFFNCIFLGVSNFSSCLYYIPELLLKKGAFEAFVSDENFESNYLRVVNKREKFYAFSNLKKKRLWEVKNFRSRRKWWKSLSSLRFLFSKMKAICSN